MQFTLVQRPGGIYRRAKFESGVPSGGTDMDLVLWAAAYGYLSSDKQALHTSESLTCSLAQFCLYTIGTCGRAKSLNASAKVKMGIQHD